MKIQLKAFPINIGNFGSPVHLYWTLTDSKNNILGEIHGRAVDSSNNLKTVGLPGDKLKVFCYGPQKRSDLYSPTHECLYSYDSPDASSKWDTAINSQFKLNYSVKEFKYHPLGWDGKGNSNSVAFTLGHEMGLDMPPNFGNLVTPGYGVNLLEAPSPKTDTMLSDVNNTINMLANITGATINFSNKDIKQGVKFLGDVVKGFTGDDSSNSDGDYNV